MRKALAARRARRPSPSSRPGRATVRWRVRRAPVCRLLSRGAGIPRTGRRLTGASAPGSPGLRVIDICVQSRGPRIEVRRHQPIAHHHDRTSRPMRHLRGPAPLACCLCESDSAAQTGERPAGNGRRAVEHHGSIRTRRRAVGSQHDVWVEDRVEVAVVPRGEEGVDYFPLAGEIGAGGPDLGSSHPAALPFAPCSYTRSCRPLTGGRSLARIGRPPHRAVRARRLR